MKYSFFNFCIFLQALKHIKSFLGYGLHKNREVTGFGQQVMIEVVGRMMTYYCFFFLSVQLLKKLTIFFLNLLAFGVAPLLFAYFLSLLNCTFISFPAFVHIFRNLLYILRYESSPNFYISMIFSLSITCQIASYLSLLVEQIFQILI